VTALLATIVAGVAALGSPADDPGYRFARSLALAGPRPAGSAAERRAHARVAARFRNAGLRIGTDTFRVPGHGRSRNVVGVFDAPADCLVLVVAHTDSVPPAPGADDNASGVGTLVALAPRLTAVKPTCDVWLIATGAEERPYTGRPDHLGALAAVRRVRRLGRAGDLRFALSLDEVGRGGTMHLRSPVAAPRAGVEQAILGAARGTGLRVRWLRDSGTGNSDHREFALAGLPAAKLGVPDEPCRHTACDTVARLHAGTFPRVRQLVEQLLSR
jgi:Zn-dependent M28 family amino/carboxypeptidase